MAKKKKETKAKATPKKVEAKKVEPKKVEKVKEVKAPAPAPIAEAAPKKKPSDRNLKREKRDKQREHLKMTWKK